MRHKYEMSDWSVGEAAEYLQVSERQVRALLHAGRMQGRRIGRTWVVDRAALQRAAGRPVRGRPWSPSSAWDVLRLAAGREVHENPVRRHRARERLAAGFQNIVPRLGSRAATIAYLAHRGVLDDLLDDERLVRAGVSAASSVELDLVALEGNEAYLRRSELERLVETYRLTERPERPNLVLRVVKDDVWPFDDEERDAWSAVVAADLFESTDERTRRAGMLLTESL